MENNNNDKTRTVRLHVDGMMCQKNCGTTVEKALRSVPGVLDAEVSFATSSAWVTLAHASCTGPNDVIQAVEDVGFEARLATPTSATATARIYCQVEGMMCQRNCGTTVTNALLQTPKVLVAEASFRHGQAWAEVALEDYNDPNMKQQIVDAIECVGFDATLISEQEALAQQQQQQQQQHKVNNNYNNNVMAPPERPHHPNDNVIILSVEGMSCAVCTGKVERCLLKVPGVATAFVSLATHRAEITHQDSSASSASASASLASTQKEKLEDLAHACQQQVNQLGYPCQILSVGNDNSMTLHDNARKLEDAKYSELRSWRNLLILALVLLAPMLIIKRQMSHLSMESMNMEEHNTYHHSTAATMNHVVDVNYNYTLHEWDWDQGDDNSTTNVWNVSLPAMSTKSYHLSTTCGKLVLIMAVLSTLSQILVGYRFYRGAWNAGRDMGMDALIVMGTTSSWIYSVCVWIWLLVESHTQVAPDNTTLQPTFGTGPMLLTFVTFGKFLEAYAKGKTSSALEALMKLQPSWASRIVSGLEGWNDTTLQRNGAFVGEDSLQPQSQQLQLSALQTEEVSAWDVRIGDYLRVLPGARIPADGVIVALSSTAISNTSGRLDKVSKGSQTVAYIDESSFSGEPFPVPKSIGESVFGSSVNQLSVLVIRVTATGSNSVLAKIVRLMEDAQRQKAPIQAYADRIASIFAPAVMGLALITFLLWVVLDWDAQSNEERLFLAFLSAISVVVVACPCALGLATPTAVMVGTGVGATHGLLIKGGSVLEEMQSIDTFVFDKTGTLTTGKAILGVRRELIQDPQDPLLHHLPTKVFASSAAGDKTNQSMGHNLALWLAACAEQQSEHPLAEAVVNAAKSLWGGDVTCSKEGVTVDEFSVTPGSGVECRVSKPQWGTYVVRVGNKQWTQEPVEHNVSWLPRNDNTGDDAISELRRLGQIGVYVSVLKCTPEYTLPDLSTSSPPERSCQAAADCQRRRIVGVLGIVDPIREQAKSTVAALNGLGIEVFLLTGDHETTAQAVARQVGISEQNVCAGVKPEEKAEYLTKLQARRGWTSSSMRNGDGACSRVGFVGDGINDSIALARANVGIAIGAGTEVAVEAADIVLVRSNLHDVVVALHLSKVVFRRIRMNFVWAMAYNLMALPFAAGILYPFTHFSLPPEYAGLILAFSSVSVVTSSLLLRTYKRPTILDDGSLEGGSGLLQLLMRSCDNKGKALRANIGNFSKTGKTYEILDADTSDLSDEELELV